MRMTLSEIAASLQVSPATVSIVRSGKPGVSPFTRRRIQMKLEENGYSYKEYIVPGSDMPPSQQPGWLKKQIRLLKFFHSSLLTDKNDGFVDAIIDAVGAYARAAGYAILFSSVSQEDYSDVLAQLRSDTCDGLLVLATEMSREEIMQLAALPMPVVILDSDHPGLPFSCVTMDNRDIAYQAMMHLISLGTRDIGYLRSTIRTGNFVSRENGYIEALRAEHIAPDPALIFNLTPSLTGAYQDMAACLREGQRVPRALFADNDILAIGAMRALCERGLRVPEDVYIIGVDNTLLSQVSSPTLSNMQISRSSLGQMAISTLLRQIDAPGSERFHLRVCGHLMIRRSTGGEG